MRVPEHRVNRARRRALPSVGMSTFWLDHEYDRERAGDGTSRYAARVRSGLAEFADTFGDIAPVTFAGVAWRLAGPPALDPGFVRWHPRVLDAACDRNQWDGTLTARITIVSRWPAELTWSRQWGRDRGWRDWPQTFGQYLRPSEQDVARAPHLRAALLVEAPVPIAALPAAPDGPADDVAGAALRAVTVLVRELNELVDPIVQQLEAGVP